MFMNKNFFFKILFIIIVIVQGVTFAFSHASIRTDSTKFYYQRNPVYKQRVEMFKLNKLNRPDIVMFGDSHTQGANWNELLGKYKIVNRGIAGDDTQGMLARINSVIKLHPKIVVVQGGINDIYNWVPTNVIFNNLKKIITIIEKSGANPIVVSVIFSGRKWGEDWIKMHRPDIDVPKYNKERNGEVKKLNRLLKNFCSEKNIEFVDINKYLSDNNFLKNIYSRDNLHLNSNGYRIWRRELLKALHK